VGVLKENFVYSKEEKEAVRSKGGTIVENMFHA
jgi:hypothetical protein